MAKLVFLIAFLVIAGASARTLRVVDDTRECLRDVQEIAHQIPKVAKNLETMNIFGLMQDQFVVQESFKKAVVHCSSFEVTRFLNQSLVNGPAECFADILALVPKIQKFLADLASGNMTAIINDIQELIPLVQKTIQDCGAQGKKIANSKLNNFFNNFASEQCEAARQESVEAFANFMMSARSRNMSQAAQTFPVFIARVSSILHDCHLGQTAWNPSRYNFMEINHRNDNCSDDIAAIIKLVNQLIEHLQAGDIANVINDVIQLFPLLEKAADDCFQSVKQINPMDYVNMTTYNDWAKCIQGIVALVPHLQKLIQDITAGNISAVVEDINKLIPLVNQTISDCASAKTNLKPQHLINYFPSSACKNNWQMLVHNILNIQAARESHNMIKVFNMLPETVKLSTATINTCSKQRPLLIA